MSQPYFPDTDDSLSMAGHSLHPQDLGMAWRSYAEEFLQAFFRERLWLNKSQWRIHHIEGIDFMIGHMSTLLLSAFAIENLVKACAYEAFKNEPKSTKKLFHHQLNNIADLVKAEWHLTIPEGIIAALVVFTDLIDKGIAKYPIPTNANGNVHLTDWNELKLKEVKMTWNFFWNEFYRHCPTMSTRPAFSPPDSFTLFEKSTEKELEVLIKGMI